MKIRLPRFFKDPNDPFAFFKRTAREAFDFLLKEHGFEYISAEVNSYECLMRFRNQTTGVSVIHEFGGSAWVSLIKLGGGTNRDFGAKRYGLDSLVAERCPERQGEIAWKHPYGKASEQDLENLLRAQAALLRAYGGDILSGDFSIFPALKKRAAAFRRQNNKEMFGTYSGGSPRFSGRPTLAEVFADAKKVDPTLARMFGDAMNQDKTAHYVYEAYWDYEYTVTEIAKYLNIDEAAVERMLEEVDDYG